MSQKLLNKVAVVTGASGGIGLSIDVASATLRQRELRGTLGELSKVTRRLQYE